MDPIMIAGYFAKISVVRTDSGKIISQVDKDTVY
jgi:hypothetical protein